ncbi:helix-turn-helix domain-containing protein [Fodinicola acaciae]|uniref:helix-turn-helix domain-containing protein n=1 Tax=Fodinicola acaciae TaxID=2681555 RepID=UPI001FE884F0|nr:helix-turn-helix domain-containing protein [Fodinicola acaciae]
MGLIGHPVRLRIVHAMRAGQVMTTAQLCERLPDVSKAMVYRHIDLLVSGGVLEVADEQRVRGAVERHFRLRQEKAVIEQEKLTADDYRQGFAVVMAVLAAEFDAYLQRQGADPVADLVGIRQHSVWLSREELLGLIDDLRAAIVPRLANEPTTNRRQFLLSPIFFPVDSRDD